MACKLISNSSQSPLQLDFAAMLHQMSLTYLLLASLSLQRRGTIASGSFLSDQYWSSSSRHLQLKVASPKWDNGLIVWIVQVYFCLYICTCVVRTPVLATSVQEQLETGSKSKEELPEEASQVDLISQPSLFYLCLSCTFFWLLVYDKQLMVTRKPVEHLLGSLYTGWHKRLPCCWLLWVRKVP